MKTKYEFINFPSDFPIRISLKKVTNQEKDWHTLIKILYVVEGSAKISFDDTNCTISTDDIILINPWTIYEIDAPNELVYIDFEINVLKYGINEVENDSFYFKCNSALDNNHKVNYKVLKSCILALIKINTKYKTNLKYINNSLSNQIIYVLLEQFRVEGHQVDPKDSKHFRILRKIIDYIDENYANDLSLNEIANVFGYTPQYFSSFFSKHMNQTFQAYYDSIRINKHFSLLESSDFPLEEIAYKCGFNDYRSYIRAFKNIYKVTPSEYRKSKLKSTPINKDFSFDTRHYLDVIFNHKIASIENMSATIDKSYNIKLSYNKKGEEIKKTFLSMTSVGRASDLLRANTREIINQVQAEVGFKYIRFHGLFSDDMHVYRKFTNGESSYSFVFIDQVFDYLKSVNLKPFLELSFMPRDLARDKNKIVFESKFNSSAPESLEEWLRLVKVFMLHIINKYTLDEVKSWPISIWCEPDSTTHAFGFSSDEEFYTFYRETYNLLKGISSRLKVGSPSLIPFASWAIDWDKRFLSYTRENGCLPDFICVNYYANDFDFFINGKKIEKISKDPDNLNRFIKALKEDSYFHFNKIYLTQWSLTSSQRNLLNDTIYSSCYITKSILENMDELSSFTKWSLSDFMDETQLPNKTYHGGLGLFTYNGIAKAGYQAIRLLSKLSNEVIDKGNSYYITRGSNSIQIMTYNYDHYCDLYADGEYFTLKEHSRYDPFLMKNCNKYSFHFEELPFEYARVKVTRITKESGSSYDIYESMSKVPFESIEEINDLKALSIPKYELFEIKINNGCLDLDIKLNTLEVKLVEIKLYKKKPL